MFQQLIALESLANTHFMPLQQVDTQISDREAILGVSSLLTQAPLPSYTPFKDPTI